MRFETEIPACPSKASEKAGHMAGFFFVWEIDAAAWKMGGRRANLANLSILLNEGNKIASKLRLDSNHPLGWSERGGLVN